MLFVSNRTYLHQAASETNIAFRGRFHKKHRSHEQSLDASLFFVANAQVFYMASQRPSPNELASVEPRLTSHVNCSLLTKLVLIFHHIRQDTDCAQGYLFSESALL